MTVEAKTEIIEKLEHMFHGPGLAAAVNEVLSCVQFPSYLAGVLQEEHTNNEAVAVLAWSIHRGQLWEV